jgi:hypothetical protein
MYNSIPPHLLCRRLRHKFLSQLLGVIAGSILRRLVGFLILRRLVGFLSRLLGFIAFTILQHANLTKFISGRARFGISTGSDISTSLA